MDVSRSGKSPLGNPYRMCREADREAVCSAYDELLYASLHEGADSGRVREIGARHGCREAPGKWNDRSAAREVARLRVLARGGQALVLACHCRPRQCHADSIAAAVEAE